MLRETLVGAREPGWIPQLNLSITFQRQGRHKWELENSKHCALKYLKP